MSILPGELKHRLTRFTEAIQKGTDLAQQARVDVWFTANHTNYVQVATFREE